LVPQRILLLRDALRQTTLDFVQLVQVIKTGMDIDGDSVADIDPSRIYYLGQSRGGQYGTLLLAVEPDIHAGILNITGGPQIDLLRLSPASRSIFCRRLQERVPSLLNAPGISVLDGIAQVAPLCNENFPLRDGVSLPVTLANGTTRAISSPVINDVPGAMAIQEFMETSAWVFQSGNPVAYGPHLRRNPLNGVSPKSVLIQFAKTDQTIPNPVATAVIRAGDLADRTTFYRHDLAFADNPTLAKDPHSFLFPPVFGSIATATLTQAATFFATDGTQIIQPEPARYFEVPVVLPLPEDLDFIP
jgi:hypothetical protein